MECVVSKSGLKRETVEKLTYYVVQNYQTAGRAGISADDPLPARNRDHAMRLFNRYLPLRAGVVAFYRTGNPATGDWDDATIIARHGKLPAEVDGFVDETAMDPWELEERALEACLKLDGGREAAAYCAWTKSGRVSSGFIGFGIAIRVAAAHCSATRSGCQ
jgi:hypothetical protein